MSPEKREVSNPWFRTPEAKLAAPKWLLDSRASPVINVYNALPEKRKKQELKVSKDVVAQIQENPRLAFIKASNKTPHLKGYSSGKTHVRKSTVTSNGRAARGPSDVGWEYLRDAEEISVKRSMSVVPRSRNRLYSAKLRTLKEGKKITTLPEEVSFPSAVPIPPSKTGIRSLKTSAQRRRARDRVPVSTIPPPPTRPPPEPPQKPRPSLRQPATDTEVAQSHHSSETIKPRPSLLNIAEKSSSPNITGTRSPRTPLTSSFAVNPSPINAFAGKFTPTLEQHKRMDSLEAFAKEADREKRLSLYNSSGDEASKETKSSNVPSRPVRPKKSFANRIIVDASEASDGSPESKKGKAAAGGPRNISMEKEKPPVFPFGRKVSKDLDSPFSSPPPNQTSFDAGSRKLSKPRDISKSILSPVSTWSPEKQDTETFFSTDSFLKSLGRLPGKLGQTHPFPDFETPEDHDIREAYYQVRDTLLALWFSKGAPGEIKTSTEASPSTPSTMNRPSESSERPSLRKKASSFLRPAIDASPTPPVPPIPDSIDRPTLKKKGSSFRLFNRQPSQDYKSSPIAGSLYGFSTVSLASPEAKTRSIEAGIPTSLAKAPKTEQILVIAETTLIQLQKKFNFLKYDDLEDYVANKPFEQYSTLQNIVKEEEIAVQKNTIPDSGSLQTFGTWLFPRDQTAWQDLETEDDIEDIDNPIRYVSCTILDQQREILTMTRTRRKEKDLRLPLAGLRIMWAARFVEWATEQHETHLFIQAAQEAERAAARAQALKELHVGMNLPPPSTPNQYQDQNQDQGQYQHHDQDQYHPTSPSPHDLSADNDELLYAGLLKDIESQATTTPLNQSSLSPSDPLSPTRTLRDEDPESAKKRRRRTAFNAGLVSAEPFPMELQEVAQRVHAVEKVKSEWEYELERGLVAERERQERERGGKLKEKRGSGNSKRSGEVSRDLEEVEWATWRNAHRRD